MFIYSISFFTVKSPFAQASLRDKLTIGPKSTARSSQQLRLLASFRALPGPRPPRNCSLQNEMLLLQRFAGNSW